MSTAEIIFGGFIAFVLAATGYFFYVARKVEPLEEEEYQKGRPRFTAKEGALELVKVKGIGPKLSKKMKKTGISNVGELASSTPKILAESLGISKERASRFIKDARSLLKK